MAKIKRCSFFAPQCTFSAALGSASTGGEKGMSTPITAPDVTTGSRTTCDCGALSSDDLVPTSGSTAGTFWWLSSLNDGLPRCDATTSLDSNSATGARFWHDLSGDLVLLIACPSLQRPRWDLGHKARGLHYLRFFYWGLLYDFSLMCILFIFTAVNMCDWHVYNKLLRCFTYLVILPRRFQNGYGRGFQPYRGPKC